MTNDPFCFSGLSVDRQASRSTAGLQQVSPVCPIQADIHQVEPGAQRPCVWLAGWCSGLLMGTTWRVRLPCSAPDTPTTPRPGLHLRDQHCQREAHYQTPSSQCISACSYRTHRAIRYYTNSATHVKKRRFPLPDSSGDITTTRPLRERSLCLGLSRPFSPSPHQDRGTVM